MEEKTCLKKTYDAVLLTCNVLKRLGAGDLDTFNQRLKTQKVQYFAQLFGVSPCYSFNLYLRGPYSPELSNDLFKIKEEKIEITTSKFATEEMENKFLELKKFIDGKTLRQLEIIATYHWLTKVARLNEKDAEEKLNELKGTSNSELRDAKKAMESLAI